MQFEKDLVFLIGAPRSGTTWLQAMLAAHSDVASSDELNVFNSYVKPALRAWEHQKTVLDGHTIGLPVVWSDDDFYTFWHSFLNDVYTRALGTNTLARYFIDKCPGCATCVDVIHRFYPYAKYIHVIRDGRDVVTSLMEAGRSWGENWAPTSAAKAAVRWRNCVYGGRYAENFAGRYIEVRYEALRENGVEELQRIFDFLNIEITEDTARQIYNEHAIDKMRKRKSGVMSNMPPGFYRKGAVGDWHDKLTVGQKYDIERQAGQLLRELGYASGTWWTQSRLDSIVIPIRQRILKKRS